jgi:hypothetical protein
MRAGRCGGVDMKVNIHYHSQGFSRFLDSTVDYNTMSAAVQEERSASLFFLNSICDIMEDENI